MRMRVCLYVMYIDFHHAFQTHIETGWHIEKKETSHFKIRFC